VNRRKHECRIRPAEEELRVIEANRRKNEKTSDVIRRALRMLDREAWDERARADMHRLRSEDLSAEADAWEYGADGNIRIAGTDLTVPARRRSSMACRVTLAFCADAHACSREPDPKSSC
jgi:hypothetical protein